MNEFDNKMKIKSLTPWFGGKRNLAPRIVELLGEHNSYWEPFCGSMAVLFAKPLCKMEIVNDLHGDIVNLARVIRDREMAFELYDKVCRTVYSEDLFREVKQRFIKYPDIDSQTDQQRAYDFFVVSWMGINGYSGTKRCNYQFAMRWSRGGGQGSMRWQSVVSSMPAWHKRLRKVDIIRRDGLVLLENIKDEAGVAIYCDPPYFDVGEKYLHGFEDEDHRRLAESIRRFEKAKVIVSYYDCPQVRDLYEGFELIEMGRNYASLRNATRGKKTKQRKEQVEVLVMNKKPEGLFNLEFRMQKL